MLSRTENSLTPRTAGAPALKAVPTSLQQQLATPAGYEVPPAIVPEQVKESTPVHLLLLMVTARCGQDHFGTPLTEKPVGCL